MKRKRGFTIVELVIVIAVVGILAAILIPTFSGLISKANLAKDVATVTNINKVYTADKANKSINRCNTMYQALNEISDNGFDLNSIQKNSSGNHFIAWDRIKDRFVLVDKSNNTFKDGDEDVHIENKYDFFRVYDNIPAQQDYSIYLTNKNIIGDIDNLEVGLDCGDNKSITNLTYDRRSESTKRDVYIRTSKGTHAEIHGYDDGAGVGDKIYHFGEASEIIEDSASGSFYECGASAYTVVNKGHYVQNAGTIVSYLEAKASEGDVVIDFKNGTKQGTFKNTNTTNSVEVNGEHNAEIVNLNLNISNGPISVDLEMQPIYANQVDSIGTNSNSFDYSLNGIGDAVSLPPSGSSCTEHHFVSIPGYSVRICETCCEFEYEEEIVERNDQIYEPRVESYAYTPTNEGLEKSNISEDHVHEYGEPDWYWLSESVVTAKFVCSSSDCNKSISYTIDYDDPSEDAYIEYVVVSKEDCTHMGTYRCIAHLNMNDHNYESEREGYKEVPALGHQIVTHEAKTATCEEDGWNEYETCSREGCDHSTYEENIIKATGHEGNPCVHCGQVFVSVKFTNTDKYIYRVGNSNAALASWLFSSIPSDFNETNVEVIRVKGQAGGSYNSASQSFTFTSTGIVSIAYKNEVLLTLEVVDGTNIFGYDDFPSSGNIVFMNDIIMSNGGTKHLSNRTLFGNGFLFDVTKAATTHSKPMTSNNFVICLDNSTLDNVQIQGALYSSYGVQVSNNYNFPTVLFTGGNCSVLNSYISNCASPIRAVSSGEYMIKNTTLCGGSYCNLDIRTSSHITLDNLTTINQSNGNDDGSKLGLGIVLYYEGGANPTIDIINGIHQYNYLRSNETTKCVSIAQGFAGKIFDVDSKFIYNDNNVQVVNTGILSMSSSFDTSNLSSVDGYEWNSKSLGVSVGGNNYSGQLFTELSSTPETPNKYEPIKQGVIEPVFTFNLPTDNSKPNYSSQENAEYCYYDTTTQTILIRIIDGNAFQFDPRIATVQKYGSDINYTITMNNVDYSQSSISFDAEGEYTIKYRYSDANNYGESTSNNEVINYEKTLLVKVIIYEESKAPEFGFICSGGEFETKTISNKKYVMPKVENPSSTSLSSKTISGEKVYMPTINALISSSSNSLGFEQKDGFKSSHAYAQYRVFDTVLTIKDYDGDNNPIEYSPESSLQYDSSEGAKKLYKVSGNSGLKLVRDSGAESALKYGTGSNTDLTNESYWTPKYYSGKWVFQSADASTNGRDATNYVLNFEFTSNSGDKYYYFVQYHLSSKTKECLLPDTLITMANNTKKMAKDVEAGDLLKVFNHETGSYDVSPVVFNDKEEAVWQTVVNLEFSNGEEVGVISEHGFFDMNLMQYVYIREDNYLDFVGHQFYADSGLITLDSVYITEEYTEVYSPVTAVTLNYFTNDILSMPGGIEGLFNIFEYDSTLQYNQEKMEADIAMYGLLDYSYYEDFLPYEVYVIFNGKYLGISMAKGILTEEMLMHYVERYSVYW